MLNIQHLLSALCLAEEINNEIFELELCELEEAIYRGGGLNDHKSTPIWKRLILDILGCTKTRQKRARPVLKLVAFLQPPPCSFFENWQQNAQPLFEKEIPA